MSFSTQTPLRVAILKAIAVLGVDAYGTRIADFVNANIREGERHSDPKIYVTLNRLEDGGLIETATTPKVPAGQRGPGRPRKVYNLSQSGQRALAKSLEVYADIAAQNAGYQNETGEREPFPSTA